MTTDLQTDPDGRLRHLLTIDGLPAALLDDLLDRAERFAPAAFRVTVASFNARALRVVESLGFARVGRFDAATDGRSFEVLVRPSGSHDARGPAPVGVT